MLVEYAPLLAYAQELAEQTDPHERVLVFLDAMKWLAARSDNDIDDEVLRLVSSVVESEEGEALFNYVVEAVKGLLKK